MVGRYCSSSGSWFCEEGFKVKVFLIIFCEIFCCLLWWGLDNGDIYVVFIWIIFDVCIVNVFICDIGFGRLGILD